MFNKKTIRDIDFAGKIVLVRTDYNVPLTDANPPAVSSDLRIRASLPTLNYLLEHEAEKIILISHLGRPKGPDEKLSLKPITAVLAELLPGHTISFVDATVGPEVEAAVEALPKGGILLLENLRFDPREEANSEDYAQEIVSSTHADIFIQDGFAVVHRAHASTSAIAHLLPSVAGLLLEKEIDTLSKVLHNPERPLTLILGGAKVEDKQPLIDKFLALADNICIGGKLAADASGALASQLASSDSEPRKDGREEERATEASAQVYLADDFDEDAAGNKLDIGPLSTAQIVERIEHSKTVIWNGLLGKAEDPAFATSSTIVAKVLGENPNITSVICGGDTTGFVEDLQQEDPVLTYSLISTGGGAALEFLCGKPLPGYEALENKG